MAREELIQMNQRTRKLMTMHKALHPRDDIDRLYVSRREGGKVLARIEDSVDTSLLRLKDYIQTRGRRLITATSNNTIDTRTSGTTITRKQKWKEKQFCGHFKRLKSLISREKTGIWLKEGNLKRETKSLLIAAQKNAIKTNDIKARIDKAQQNSCCRLCNERDETINHIKSECSNLALKEYKTRHDRVGKVIHWDMRNMLKFDHTNKLNMHYPESVLEKDIHTLLCDFEIQIDHQISSSPCKKEDEWRPSKLQYYWDRPEYWEESLRLEVTCCQLQWETIS